MGASDKSSALTAPAAGEASCHLADHLGSPPFGFAVGSLSRNSASAPSAAGASTCHLANHLVHLLGFLGRPADPSGIRSGRVCCGGGGVPSCGSSGVGHRLAQSDQPRFRRLRVSRRVMRRIMGVDLFGSELPGFARCDGFMLVAAAWRFLGGVVAPIGRGSCGTVQVAVAGFGISRPISARLWVRPWVRRRVRGRGRGGTGRRPGRTGRPGMRPAGFRRGCRARGI